MLLLLQHLHYCCYRLHWVSWIVIGTGCIGTIIVVRIITGWAASILIAEMGMVLPPNQTVLYAPSFCSLTHHLALKQFSQWIFLFLSWQLIVTKIKTRICTIVHPKIELLVSRASGVIIVDQLRIYCQIEFPQEIKFKVYFQNQVVRDFQKSHKINAKLIWSFIIISYEICSFDSLPPLLFELSDTACYHFSWPYHYWCDTDLELELCFGERIHLYYSLFHSNLIRKVCTKNKLECNLRKIKDWIVPRY